MARRRRGLQPDERDLWNRVARTANPLHPGRIAPPADPPARIAETAPPPEIDLSDLRIGGRARVPPGLIGPGPKESRGPRMDAKAHARMTRGKLPVERRIDLHGLTLAEAHPRLVSFVLSAHAHGLRLVLVITGKGRDRDDGDPVPVRRGLLRQQVPRWLDAPPLRGVVLQVTDAHRRHGGSGAFYVYLRRK